MYGVAVGPRTPRSGYTDGCVVIDDAAPNETLPESRARTGGRCGHARHSSYF